MLKIGLMWSTGLSFFFVGVDSVEEMRAGAAGRGGGEEEKLRGRVSPSSTTLEMFSSLEVRGLLLES